MAGDWTTRSEITGTRPQRALAYADKMAEIVNGETDESWDALLPLIDVDRFVRKGNERTGMDWQAYRPMLEQWRAHSGNYEKTFHGASEAGNFVYVDLDEKSTDKNGSVTTLRSISIYEFDEQDRIIALDMIMGFHQSPT